jgi:hypothetical protein
MRASDHNGQAKIDLAAKPTYSHILLDLESIPILYINTHYTTQVQHSSVWSCASLLWVVVDNTGSPSDKTLHKNGFDPIVTDFQTVCHGLCPRFSASVSSGIVYREEKIKPCWKLVFSEHRYSQCAATSFCSFKASTGPRRIRFAPQLSTSAT